MAIACDDDFQKNKTMRIELIVSITYMGAFRFNILIQSDSKRRQTPWKRLRSDAVQMHFIFVNVHHTDTHEPYIIYFHKIQ